MRSSLMDDANTVLEHLRSVQKGTMFCRLQKATSLSTEDLCDALDFLHADGRVVKRGAWIYPKRKPIILEHLDPYTRDYYLGTGSFSQD